MFLLISLNTLNDIIHSIHTNFSKPLFVSFNTIDTSVSTQQGDVEIYILFFLNILFNVILNRIQLRSIYFRFFIFFFIFYPRLRFFRHKLGSSITSPLRLPLVNNGWKGGGGRVETMRKEVLIAL